MKEDVLRAVDTLIVPKYDRMGRAKETKAELEYFKENGIRVVFFRYSNNADGFFND